MNKRKISGLMTVLLLLAVLLGACSMLPGGGESEPIPVATLDPDEANVISEGNIEPNEYRRLSFASGGQVEEILAAKGDRVSQGQVLARLGDSEQIEAARAAAEFEIQAAQQALDEINETAKLAAANAWNALLEAQ